MAHWGKEVVKWSARELPAVITGLGQVGPECVFDVMAERYREWLKIHGPRLGLAPAEVLQEVVPNEPPDGAGAGDAAKDETEPQQDGTDSKASKKRRRGSNK